MRGSSPLVFDRFVGGDADDDEEDEVADDDAVGGGVRNLTSRDDVEEGAAVVVAVDDDDEGGGATGVDADAFEARPFVALASPAGLGTSTTSTTSALAGGFFFRLSLLPFPDEDDVDEDGPKKFRMSCENVTTSKRSRKCMKLEMFTISWAGGHSCDETKDKRSNRGNTLRFNYLTRFPKEKCPTRQNASRSEVTSLFDHANEPRWPNEACLGSLSRGCHRAHRADRHGKKSYDDEPDEPDDTLP